MNNFEGILKKWEVLINACKSYYIDSQPTGLLDEVFDDLEKRAIEEDGFYARDYVFNTFLQGVKTKNKWIEKIIKVKVSNTSMINAIKMIKEKLNEDIYCDLKYDGSSLAIYLDPKTGKPIRIVTVGNLNLDNLGVDQTWKLIHLLPQKFPKGIVAIQAEALIDLENLPDGVDPERARQKANGLINSKYCEEEIDQYLTIRAYRYYTDNSIEGEIISNTDYKDVLNSFETVTLNNRVVFSPAQVWSINELSQILQINPTFTEIDRTSTPTGTFLNDGWVIYHKNGKCECALKFAQAGSNTENIIKTRVKSIQWNSQLSKGKDSWSANVIIDPVTIKGCIIKKPSSGSVSKLVKNNITKGAEVSIVLANSTIPMVGDVFSGGDGNFEWPKCSCGYQMSEKDIFGSLLKCGNPYCTERYNRMSSYISSLDNIKNLDLNKFLVIDRFNWKNTDIDIEKVLNFVILNNIEEYKKYLDSFMKTELQKKNMSLVVNPSFKALRDSYEKSTRV